MKSPLQQVQTGISISKCDNRFEGCSCALTWSMHLIIFVNNAMRQAHSKHVRECPLYNGRSLTVIIKAKPCAWLMALLTKIMRYILQVTAQEQPG